MVGNISNYTKADILRCFFLISKKISREELVRKLDIGEGTVKNLLNILKRRKLVSSTKKGHSLTKKGEEVMEEIKANMELPRELTTKNLFAQYKKSALLIRKHRKIKSYVSLRDIAVKNGAEGAIILVYDNGLRIPDFQCDDRLDYAESLFDYRNGDLLIITFGKSLRWCEVAAITMAFEMNTTLKNLF